MKSLHEINHRDIPDTLILSLDFDGCTDKPEARQKLIEFIIDYCSTRPHYKFVALAIGSLRQSVLTDYYNAVTHYKTHGNQLTCEYDEAGVKHFLQSWSVELEQFEDYKQWRDTWQPAQITAQNKFGQQISLFTTALNEPSHPGNSIQFDDPSKILVLYMLHQFVANKIKKAFDTLHLDDRTDLLDPIDLFYQTHPTLLPLNSAYQSVAWNSDEDFDASQIKMGPAIFGIS